MTEIVRTELSKTDNDLLRAIDPDMLADSILRLEEPKQPGGSSSSAKTNAYQDPADPP